MALSLLGACATPTTKSDKKKRSEEVTAQVQVPSVSSASSNATPTRLNPAAQQMYTQALTAMRNRQDGTAEQLLTTLVKSQPSLSEAQTNLGIVQFRAGRYEQAEGSFTNALKQDPKNAVAYNYLGILYRIKGQFPEAKKAYEQALSISPNYSYALLNLGILHDIYLRDYSKAMEIYQRYQQLQPQEDKEVSKWISDLKRRQESGKKEGAK